MKKIVLLVLLVLITSSLTPRALAGPLSFSGVNPSSPTSGLIDPTDPAYNSNAPMRCTVTSTPDAAFAEQNRLALQQAITDAATTGKQIWIPRCQIDSLNLNAPCPLADTGPTSCGYPIPKKVGVGTANIFGVQIVGKHDITFRSDGAVLREFFDAAAGCPLVNGLPKGCQDMWGIEIDNSQRIKFIGLTFSQRDITNPFEQDHWLAINTSSSTRVDDVYIANCRFVDAPKNAGDMIRMLGGGLVIGSSGYAQRVTIVNNYFDHASRAGVSFQRGYRFVDIFNNTFKTTLSGTDIHNEPTSDGFIGPLLIVNNLFDRTGASGAASVTVPGNSQTAPATGTWIVDNIFVNGGGLSAGNIGAWISGNTMYWDGLNGTSLSQDPAWLNIRSGIDVWFTDNWVIKGPHALANDLFYGYQQAGECGGGGTLCAELQNWWITGNRFATYAGPNVGIHLDTVEDVWIADNAISYHNASDTGVANTAFHAIQFDCTMVGGTGINGTNSAWITNNDIFRGFQSDGVTLAGRIYTGILLGATQTTCDTGHLTIRDNRVRGAINFLVGNGTRFTPSDLTEGLPVITGNIIDSSTVFELDSNSAVTRWREESQTDAETLAGAGGGITNLAVSRRVSFVSAVASTAEFDLATGAQDGFVKRVVLPASTQLLIIKFPGGFADGSEVDSQTSTAGEVDVVWDATASTWRLLNSRGVTVIP